MGFFREKKLADYLLGRHNTKTASAASWPATRAGWDGNVFFGDK
jgi:hypothetical protein